MVGAWGTTGAMAQATEGGAEPVDQGFEDRGPLSTSLREIPAELRVGGGGFGRVYRLPGLDGQYVRSSGALRAVFPRSLYVSTRQGVIMPVPAGTVYVIGDPRGTEVQRRARAFHARQLDDTGDPGPALPIGPVSGPVSAPVSGPVGATLSGTVSAVEPELGPERSVLVAATDEGPSMSDERYRRARLWQIARQLAPGAMAHAEGAVPSSAPRGDRPAEQPASGGAPVRPGDR